MKLFSTLTLIFLFSFANAQENKFQQDRDAIKAMSGCYKVTFQYAETFAEDTAYQYHDRYKADGLEWIFVDEETENKIVLQHLLVVTDSVVLKHWRQDWLYENTAIYNYRKELNWEFEELPKEQVKGQWTQKVYQVDDSARYEGSATWVHVDGKHYWKNTTDAPLPRRESSKRSDYNVLRRTNRHIITSYGWLHEQDNKKIIRNDSTDKILVEEKGYNNYKKVDDKKCQPAVDWWKINRPFWVDVRAVWNEVYAKGEDLDFHKEIDGEVLRQPLFKLGGEAANNDKSNSTETKEAIRSIINQYLKEKQREN